MSGWLHVIAGPMFSGKTEELVRLVRRQHYAGKSVMVFRPTTDTRDQEPGVLSRSGAFFPSTFVTAAFDITDIVAVTNPDVVAVDEAQFFGTNLASILDRLADAGKIVFVAGLDKDFAGREFGPMGYLLVHADEVTKLTSICNVCKGEASRTQRLINGEPASVRDTLVVIGGKGDDKYEARCRADHEVRNG